MVDRPKIDPVDRVELDRREVAQFKQIVAKDPDDPSWIAFSSVEAPWIQMSVDGQMARIFEARESIIRSDDENAADEWITSAQEVLHTWVTRGILASEKRAAHFRALGRGWIFLQLSSNQGHQGSHWQGSHVTTRKITRFKWWFESVERILRNRQEEFAAMRITPEEVSRWTVGYVHGAELVFALRGIIATVTLMARVKLRADYHREHVWATSDELQRAVEVRTLPRSPHPPP